MRPALTIGMATYKDYDGVYFTLQALRLYQDLRASELLVVDNFGCDATRALVEGIGGRYLRFTETQGTAAPRDRVFQEARGRAVLCLDAHVLLAPGVVARLKQYFRVHGRTSDLLQGPLAYDDLRTLASHFDPVWRDGMWGVWAIDPRIEHPHARPFEIPMQGLGLFACRKAAWPGFSPHFRGFGGEEGYIHQKFRNLGRRCLCLPWLRWLHRFGRPTGVPYRMEWHDRIINYLIGHRELGLDEEPVHDHFRRLAGPQVVNEAQAEADRIIPRPAPRRAAAANGKATAQPREPELVSCLMPTFNRVPHHAVLLAEAIESFLRQDYPHKELLILNDTPGQTLECSAPGVRILNRRRRMPDLGTKIACLIDAARGNLLCRWDDDDISLPWRLTLSVARLGKRPYWRPSNAWCDNGRLALPATRGCCHIAGIFRRGILRKIGGYPARYGEHDSEDLLFNAAAARRGVDFAEDLLPEEHFYIYRWQTGAAHLSGLGTIGAGWQRRGEERIVPGVYHIEPRWRRNYVDDTRRAIAAPTPAPWHTIEGFFDFAPLYRHVVTHLRPDAVAVEVGCWLGRSITFLAQTAQAAGKRLRLFGVDDGTGIAGTAPGLDALRANLQRCNVAEVVCLLAMPSPVAADLFADDSIDFAFIDAAHDYHNVRTDLQAWWPKVRPGGMLAGHDYTNSHPDVICAVDAFFDAAPESLRSPCAQTCWQWQKE
jgi:glycosyltransferase involved in cell wall biosynthesis